MSFAHFIPQPQTIPIPNQERSRENRSQACPNIGGLGRMLLRKQCETLHPRSMVHSARKTRLAPIATRPRHRPWN
eukprot:scaffold213335_cov30-Tisochrysis_lutea.AAC.1